MNRIARQLTTSTHLLWTFLLWTTVVVVRALPAREERDRGDVPGWVMITLMSAILVAGLLAIASPALEDLFDQAMSKVGN
ncbi:hypothetical protein ACFRJ9_18450 [Paenarthrobacter sp. NPDC056912]|uniref:hypothetical protein n=1 Tax=Paenarthrobacter sp. NPDC056912 TaxID=3345965 RepID=UPI00366B4493